MEYSNREGITPELEQQLLKRGYSRREIIKIAGAFGLAGLLAACGTVKPQTAQGQAAAGTPVAQGKSIYSIDDAKGLQWPKTVIPEPTTKVHLSVSHAWDATFWTRQVQFDTLFMQRHPNIVISAENTPFNSYLQKYVAQAAGGTLPDLMYCQFAWAQQFITQGAISTLDDYIGRQSDFNLDDFTKPSMGFYLRGGKTYGIAYDCGPGLLYYNKDLFDKAGVSYPTSDWTVDDLKQSIIKLATGSGHDRTFGFNGTPNPSDGGIGPNYLFPFGAAYVNEPEETQCLINRPEAVQAMQWWLDVRLKHNAVPSPAEAQGFTIQQLDPFTLGRSAMMLNGSWATPALSQNARFKWDFALWPKGPKGRFTFAEGSAYMITDRSQQKDAAWIYLNEYLSSAGQIFMWGMTGRGSPARKSAWDSYFKSKYAPPSARLVLDSLETSGTNQVLHQPTTPKVTTTATPIWDRVEAGQTAVPDALQQLAQQISPILSQNASATSWLGGPVAW